MTDTWQNIGSVAAGVVARVRNNEEWPHDEVNRLRELCGDKTLSSKKIATIMGKSRDAIIGKCRRMGFVLPQTPRELPKPPDGTARTQFNCENCGAVLAMKYNNAKGYRPRICRPCHTAGAKPPPPSKRVVSPWMVDESGVMGRTVEGGA